MCVESGLTRSKNNIGVAIKNLTDFSVATLIFWGFGFALMFGASQGGWFGHTGWAYPFNEHPGWQTAVFLFQTMFCATAATILSGAVAERMKFSGYIIVTLCISGILYPLFGHWAWNGNLNGTPTGWLEAKGFVDFAGSTVVHSLGGWIALACLIVVGPRIGRFSAKGEVKEFTAGNLPLSMLGVFLLWVGWLGFNGGSSLGVNDQVPGNIAKTYWAGATGALAALGVGWYLRKLPRAELLMKGSMSGLVAITANCHAVSGLSAILIGGIAALVMLGVGHLLEHFQIDDAVGAVPVHLGAGIWGTLAVALFGDPELLQTGLTRWEQLGIQILGIFICFVWTFGLGYLILQIINRVHPLRVSPDDEHRGLNISEHGATTETADLLRSMDLQAQSGDLHLRVPIDPYTEVGQIAKHYNRVLDKVSRDHDQLEHHVAERTFKLSQANTALRQEIHERQRAQDLLRESESRYRTVTENVYDMVWESDAQGQYVFVSPCHEDMAGYTPDELLSANIFSTVHPDDLERVVAEFRHIIQSQSSGQAIYRNKHKNGEWRWLETTGKTIRTTTGDIRAIGATRDITETIQAKEALRASQERLAGILNSAKDGVISIDEDQCITLFNQGAERIFGYQAGDVIGQPLDILLPPDVARSHRESIRAFSKSSSPPRYMGVYREVMGRRKDGTTFPAEATISKLVQNDHITCTVILRDITDRRQAEEELRRLNEELEQRVQERTEKLNAKNRELETFAYSVSHDLKAPLRAIDGYSRLLLEDFANRMNEEGLNFLQTIRRSSLQMDQLINDLLAYSRLERNAVTKYRINLPELIHTLIEEQGDLPAQNIELKVDLPYKWIEADSNALSQALRNLLENAIKFTRDCLHPQIKIGGRQTEQISSFWVRDNGVGFDMKYHDRIFEIFQRLHRVEEYQGTGVGLALVRKAAERMGGRVWAESQPGEGTSFHFELPRKP